MTEPKTGATLDWVRELFPAGEWLREGFLQLAIAALWRENLESLRAAGKNWVQQAEEKVYQPFLAQQWIAGVTDAAATIVPGPVSARESLKALDKVEAVARWFVQLWPADTPADLAALLAESLAAAGQSLWAPPENPVGPLLRSAEERERDAPSAMERVKRWVGQAQALQVWRTYDRQFDTKAGWRGRCDQVLRDIAARNRHGDRTGVLWFFVAGHAPEDYTLFEQAAEALKDARGEIDLVAGSRGEVLGYALPRDWPPLLLVQRVSSLVLRQLQADLDDRPNPLLPDRPAEEELSERLRGVVGSVFNT